MDPLTLGLGIVGLGTSLYGMFSQSSNAHQIANVSSDISKVEGQENDVRRQAMEMSARRNQIQTIRTAQRARAMAVQAGATQTGSLTGSGVQGGIGETTSEGLYGLQGINNNLTYGRQLFSYDSQITQDRMRLAQLGANSATDQGITSLGGSIMKVANPLGNMFRGAGSSSGSNFNPFNVTGSLY